MKLYGSECDIDNHIKSLENSLVKYPKKVKTFERQCSTSEISLKTKISDNLSKRFHHFKRPEVLKPFLIITFLSIIQQFSGMSILRAYVVKIFAKVFENSAEDNFEGKDN